MDLGNITRLMLSQEEEVSQVMKVVHLEIVKANLKVRSFIFISPATPGQ